MFRGIVLALVLLLVGDLTLNGGQLTHVVVTRLGHFLSASGKAVDASVFSA